MTFTRMIIRPLVYLVLIVVVAAVIIIGIGTTLLRLYPKEIGPTIADEFIRPDLLTAFFLSLVIIFVCALLARTPKKEHALDERIAVGSDRDFWTPETVQVDEAATRRGPLGTIADIQPGDMLYAQSGPLARVISVLPGETEYGRRRRGLIYATGVYGANEAMWIPVEAVMAVYPETHSVFLAAKGDEVEHFGWNRPPESFRRDEPRFEPPKSF
jgi:hypothetical protein